MQKYGLWTNQWMIKAVLSSLITGDPTKNQKTDYVSVKTIRADVHTL